MSRSREPVELTVMVHRELPASLLVNEGETDAAGRPAKLKALPWSQITLEAEQMTLFRRWQASPETRRGSVVLRLSVPEWLALDRGLI